MGSVALPSSDVSLPHRTSAETTATALTHAHLGSGRQVLVPAVTKMDEDEQLRRIDSLPDWVQPAFKNTESLNRIQTRVCEVPPPALSARVPRVVG
eukprot:3080490-Rhodomonas_salina.2